MDFEGKKHKKHFFVGVGLFWRGETYHNNPNKHPCIIKRPLLFSQNLCYINLHEFLLASLNEKAR